MIMPQSHQIHKHLSHVPHLPKTRVPITTSTTKRPRSFQLVRTFNNSSPTQVWNLSVDKTFVKKSIYIFTVWAIDLSPTLLLASLKTRIILAIRNTWIMNIYSYDFLEHILTKHCKMKLPMITCFVTMKCNHHQWEAITDWWPAWFSSRSQVVSPRLLPGWSGTCGSSRALLPVGRSRSFLNIRGHIKEDGYFF